MSTPTTPAASPDRPVPPRNRRAALIAAGVVALIVAGLLYFALAGPDDDQEISERNAAPGQCVDFDDPDLGYDFTLATCKDPHDAEITVVTTAADLAAQDFPSYYDGNDRCASLLSEERLAALDTVRPQVEFVLLAAGDAPDDTVICLAASRDGQLTGPLPAE
ncbi:hypothetical protein [Nocardioides sp.]|uniref:hypothetical protein n=1 Tax=Nocardioides sp. TaxID=35761 RepID=UPI0035161BB9